MLSFRTTFVLLSVVAYVHCDSSEENSVTPLKAKILLNIELPFIRNYVEKSQVFESFTSKFEELCPGSVDKISNSFDTVSECFNSIDNKLSVCASMKNNFLNCTAPFIKIMDECMLEKSKGYPLLLANMALSVTQHICGLNGEHVVELSNSCILKDNDTLAHRAQCEDQMKEKVTKIKKDIPSVSEVCSLLDSMKPCWDFHVQDNCDNDVAKEAWIGFFDAIAAPCNSDAGKGLAKPKRSLWQ